MTERIREDVHKALHAAAVGWRCPKRGGAHYAMCDDVAELVETVVSACAKAADQKHVYSCDCAECRTRAAAAQDVLAAFGWPGVEPPQAAHGGRETKEGPR